MNRNLPKYRGWRPGGSNDYTSTYLRRAEMILNKEKPPVVETKPIEAKPESIKIPVLIEEKKPSWRPPGSSSAKVYDIKRFQIIPIVKSDDTNDSVKPKKEEQQKKDMATQVVVSTEEQKPTSDLILFRDPNDDSQFFMMVDKNNQNNTSTSKTARPSTSTRVLESPSNHVNRPSSSLSSSSFTYSLAPPRINNTNTGRIVIETTIEHTPPVLTRPVTAYRLVPEPKHVVYVPERGTTLQYYKPVQIDSSSRISKRNQ